MVVSRWFFFPATVIPDPSQPAGAIGSRLVKNPSVDSAYAEEGKVVLYSGK